MMSDPNGIDCVVIGERKTRRQTMSEAGSNNVKANKGLSILHKNSRMGA
jgi:hypothetical protein